MSGTNLEKQEINENTKNKNHLKTSTRPFTTIQTSQVLDST